MIRRVPVLFLAFMMGHLFWSCESSVSKENETDNLPVDIGQVIRFSDHFEIKVPDYFVEMDDINPNAIVQYGAISDEKDSLSDDFEDEIYVTVMELPKVDLSSTFADSGRVTLNKINDRTAINLELILDDFKAVNKSPKSEMINGLSAIKNEFFGRLGQYKVYYKMGVFETETHYYQLLTWCMQKHAQKHKDEMDGIILSFENV